MQKLFSLVIFSTILFSISTKAQNADIIFTNANIITAASKGARANSMAIKDGKILFAGDI